MKKLVSLVNLRVYEPYAEILAITSRYIPNTYLGPLPKHLWVIKYGETITGLVYCE